VHIQCGSAIGAKHMQEKTIEIKYAMELTSVVNIRIMIKQFEKR
jgi:hypothetical protein